LGSRPPSTAPPKENTPVMSRPIPSASALSHGLSPSQRPRLSTEEAFVPVVFVAGAEKPSQGLDRSRGYGNTLPEHGRWTGGQAGSALGLNHWGQGNEEKAGEEQWGGDHGASGRELSGR
jgi:hypothetical protein